MKSYSELLKLTILGLLLSIPVTNLAANDDGGLIIPLPGQKTVEKITNSSKKQPSKVNPKKKKKKSNTLITLPTHVQKKKTFPNTPKKPEKKHTLIDIKQKTPVKREELTIPDEIVITPADSTNQMLGDPNEPIGLDPQPSAPTVDQAASGATESSTDLPIFPKDTSSAIFMVMKTWQCENYDANTLLSHSVEVYGKEADDNFQVQGLSKDNSFKIDVDEEDITLDELLDILAQKSGRDWGVDIPSKVIYFYPKGIKTETNEGW